ncbi:MAG: hypothetical protein GY869_17855 [Planctomycetes bacterium]|nr:hypothetical protein [Planctomycetota bacterium]
MAGLNMIETATEDNLAEQANKALRLVSFAVSRETEAVKSIKDIYTNSSDAFDILYDRVDQWDMYGESLEGLILNYAELKADMLGVDVPTKRSLSAAEKRYASVVPALAADVKGQLFSFSRDSNINEYLQENPDASGIEFARSRSTSTVLNYINGKRSITTIAHCVAAETGTDVSVEDVAAYIDILKAIDWVK